MATPLDVHVREYLVSLYDLKPALRIIQLIKEFKGHLGQRCEVTLPSKE